MFKIIKGNLFTDYEYYFHFEFKNKFKINLFVKDYKFSLNAYDSYYNIIFGTIARYYTLKIEDVNKLINIIKEFKPSTDPNRLIVLKRNGTFKIKRRVIRNNWNDIVAQWVEPRTIEQRRFNINDNRIDNDLFIFTTRY